jgi:hypothetical protein
VNGNIIGQGPPNPAVNDYSEDFPVTVTLNGNTPLAGAIITCKSNTPTLLHVSSAYELKGDSPNPTFYAYANGVASTTQASLTATYENVSKTANITIIPPVIAVIEAPETLVSGKLLSVSVTLTGQPAEGAAQIVKITSYPNIIPANEVVVPTANWVYVQLDKVWVFGGYTGGVNLSTPKVTKDTTVTLTFTYLGLKTTQTVTLTP